MDYERKDSRSSSFRLHMFQSFLAVLMVSTGSSSGQSTNEKGAGKIDKAPGQRVLTGDDTKHAAELDEAIETALKADHWDEAIAKAEELLAFRLRIHGPRHFETASAEWLLKTLRQVAPKSKGDRVAYQSSNTMTEEAKALYAQGKYAEAQPLHEKALGIRRRLLTDDHPLTANSYEDVGYLLNAHGKYAEAQPLFEKALEIHRRLLTDDHPLTANSYGSLAFNLNAQGKYAAAQSLFEKALEISRRLLTDDHPDTATNYNDLAVNLNDQGKYAQAQPLYEKALEIRRRLFTDNHTETATSYNNLGYLLHAQGRYAQAQPLLDKAFEIRRRLLKDNHPDTIVSYNNVAANLQVQGRYALAQPLLEKALEISRRLLGDVHPQTATSYNNLAYNLRTQGKYAAAQPFFEKALEIYRQLFTDVHPFTAVAYNNVAYNLKDQRKYAAAQPFFEKALDINRRLLTDDHPRTAVTYNNLANNLHAQGKYAPAQALYEKALEIDRQLLGDNHPQTALGYNSLGENLDTQGKYIQAQPLLEKALEIDHRLQSDDHADAVLRRHSLGANFSAQGKYVEARDQWLSAARYLEKSRLRVAFTGLERAGTRNSVRPALAAVLARLGQPAEAWQALEEDLGRGLLDELAARQDSRLTPEERTRLRELIGTLERLDKAADATPKNVDQAELATQFAELRRQRELASIALGEFQTQLVKDHDALAGKVASLTEIQATVPADTALVTWVDIAPVGPNAADPNGEHWGVVTRSRGIPAWIPIAGSGPNGLWTKDDTGLPDRVRTELRSRPGSGSTISRPLLDKLRLQRLEPLTKALAATAEGQPAARRLIILPSRAMRGIPVEALLAPDDTRIVSYAPSATVRKYLRDQPRPGRHAGLLALGDPLYRQPDRSSNPIHLPDHGLLVNGVVPGSNAATHGLKPGDVLLAYNGSPLMKKDDLKVVVDGDKPVVVEVWRDGRSSRRELTPGKLGAVIDPRPAPEAITANLAMDRMLATARSGDEDFAPLPGTRSEVEALAQLFKSVGRPTRILLGADASEPEMDGLATSGELGQFGFIHLATHGVIDEGVTVRSAVILTQTGLPDPLDQVLHHKPAYDGRLLVREIQHGWELKAELVTLSACETALGPDSGGEGFVGFTQALLMSGARSVCLSLWKVDDRATAILMQRFYANVLGIRPGVSQPMPKAEALSEAKCWLRGLTREQVDRELKPLSRGEIVTTVEVPIAAHPFEHPYYWAGFILTGDPG
jgi:tetratricopeptide (TPR) repeat protein